MSKWIVKKGNTSVQKVLIKDKEGNVVTDLADAPTIRFHVKATPVTTTVLIEKTKGDGIEVDKPSEGYLRITLEPADTNLPPKKYYMGLEVKWSDIKKYEVTMVVDGEESEVFEIEQDIVLPEAA